MKDPKNVSMDLTASQCERLILRAARDPMMFHTESTGSRSGWPFASRTVIGAATLGRINLMDPFAGGVLADLQGDAMLGGPCESSPTLARRGS